MADNAEERPTPPYCSWGTLHNMFDRMEKEGVPARIDKSYMRGMAGGTQAQVKHALRSMGLIEADGTATPTLHAIATQPDQRPDLIGKIIRERYSPLVALPETATRGQLDEVLDQVYGLKSDTARKAVAFFVAVAAYSGILLSPYIKPKPGRPLGGSPSTPRRKPPRKRAAPEPPPPPPPSDGLHSRSLELASGGTVTVSYSVDLFDLTDRDRTFVLGLIDALRNYKSGKPQTARERKPEAKQATVATTPQPMTDAEEIADDF